MDDSLEELNREMRELRERLSRVSRAASALLKWVDIFVASIPTQMRIAADDVRRELEGK